MITFAQIFLKMRINILLFFFLISTYIYSQKQNPTTGFIENKGQIVDQKGKQNKDVLYLLNTPGLNVQIKKNGFSYDVYETKQILIKQKESLKSASTVIVSEEKPNYTYIRNFHRIDIDFIGSNSNVEIINSEKSLDYDNYYNVPNCPNGITNVYKFKKITYKNIYSNIDLDFFIPKDTTKAVEYNFIVRPGGKISDIQLKIEGGKTELIDNKIRMTTRFGKMEETIPMSWTEEENTKKQVAINYTKIKSNVYGFEGDLNSSDKTIVIDPVPIRLWGTYYAGNNQDYSTDICNDLDNNVYFAGYTGSTLNIATSGSFTVHDYSYFYGNGFITKFNTNGVRIWGVYSIARPKKIKTDTNGNLFYTGEIGSSMPNIATPGAHQLDHVGYYDNAFLIKLNTNGIREWGTYYGGNSSDKGKDICFDALNNVYLVGIAGSHNNIGTSGTHQPSHSSGYLDDDGFIVKFSPLGVRIWGTYLGGKESDRIYSCNISNDGFLYVTGNTGSNEDIGTISSFNPNLQGYGSGMIAKFDLNGNRIWGSYFNGERYCNIDQSILKDNHLYFFGLTDKQTNMNSSGTFNENFMHLPMLYGRSSFIAKFNINTQNLIWGTYFGEYIQDIEINSNDKIFIEGCTSQTSGIATVGAYSETLQISDAYIVKLNTNGQREWGTYYGGNCTEGHNGAADVNNKISIDNNNNIYLVGNTCSTSGISTSGAHQESHVFNSLGGIYNIYVAKFQDCLSSPQVSAVNPCAGSDLQLNATGGTNYSWTGPNGFTSSQQNPIITNANATHSGQYSCAITGTGGCDNTVSLNIVVGDFLAPIPNTTTLPTITGDCNTIVSTIPTALDNCAGTINATTTNPLNYTIPGNYTITWNYTDGNGNSSAQTQNITITSVTLPSLDPTQEFCIQENATLNTITITGTNILWYDALTDGNLLPNNTLLQNGMTYYASQTINGCESIRVPVTITIYNTPAPSANSSQSFCSTENATLTNIAITGTDIKWYDSPTNTTPLDITTPLADGITYYASQTVNNCESVNRTPVTISLIDTLNATDFSDYLCDDLNNGHEKIDLTNYNTSLLSSTAGNSFSYYKSLIGAQNQIPNEKINNYTDYQLTVGTSLIYVRIDNVNTCHQIVMLSLTLYSKPIIAIDQVTPICQGNSISVTAGNFNQYLWSTGEDTPSISITSAGDYWVTVTENHLGTNCSSTKDFKVVTSNKATIQNIVISDWSDNNNSISIIITNGSVGNYEYSIDGINFQNSNTFNNLPPGEYTVYVNDRNGCGVARDSVYLITYPKFFTPNNDGHNDFWKIKFTNQEPNLTINIYNRFGKLLKTLNNDSEGWDGTYLGLPQPADDYWFTVVRPNGKEYKEHFSLKR